ncbi:hypothetical protein [Tissierella sp. Yu-01]|uniref:hypothetical protein n=1 Tax=Tissierella sp. Yu-01 TaxID=3035694 RepID=UPI00240D11D3|nr:hypothetical protein [Tissierella sp. Yu-01]WFA08269.1 hypothetical protein P3962_11080 [Tissierella sp. Yu-01]
MKKTKFLALALVVALALSGAGYAYWTETLTVDTTVKTGQLDFQFGEATVTTSDEKGNIVVENISRENNGNNVDDSKLLITVRDMYPGATATIKFDVYNNSTMEGKLAGFSLKANNTENYDDHMVVTYFEVDDDVIIDSSDEPILIEDLDEILTGNKEYKFDKTKTLPVELKLGIAKCADEGDVAENLGKIEGTAPIKYTLTMNGLQWNDDGSCNEEEPDPELTCTDLDFNVNKLKSKREWIPTGLFTGYWKYHIVGTLEITWSNGTIEHEDIPKFELKPGQSKPFTRGGYSIDVHYDDINVGIFSN